MSGGQGIPELQDADSAIPKAVPINNDAVSPNGTNGRIILGKPALVPATNSNSLLENQLYEGWLYALVVNTNDSLNGLYVTKDFGANWTKVSLTTPTRCGVATDTQGTPSNNPGATAVNIVGNATGARRQPGERRPGADGRPVQPERRLHRRHGPGQPDPGQPHDAARPVLVRPRPLEQPEQHQHRGHRRGPDPHRHHRRRGAEGNHPCRAAQCDIGSPVTNPVLNILRNPTNPLGSGRRHLYDRYGEPEQRRVGCHLDPGHGDPVSHRERQPGRAWA